MELEHSFSVPVPLERAWNVLLDVERVAPCMPGATLDSVEGDNIAGKIKVKVGPIQMTYAGTAKFTERDKDARVVTLDASGRETRGAGTASASVRSQLTAAGDSTNVTVHTTLNVTGKPAQFGRGVLEEVGGRLIGIFAGNLADMLAADPGAGAAEAPATGGPEAGSAPANPSAAASNGTVPASGAVPANGTGDEALPIDVLNLSSRAWSSLRQDGIQTLGDLTRRTEQQLKAIDGVGPASLADIRTRLADRGLALAAESPAEPGGRHAGAAVAGGQGLADVTPLRPARHETPGETEPAGQAAAEQPSLSVAPAWQPPDNDAIDLLGVAGLPVLKRALPVAAGLIAVILVLLGIRRRRARRS